MTVIGLPPFSSPFDLWSCSDTVVARIAFVLPITSWENIRSITSSWFCKLVPLGRYFAAASRTLCGIGGPEFESTWIAETRFLLNCSKSPRRSFIVALSCTWFRRMSSTAPSSMACPPPWAWTIHPRQNRCQLNLGEMEEARLTRKHGMSSIANQKKGIFAPRRDRVSSNQFPEFDIPGFPERYKLAIQGSALPRCENSRKNSLQSWTKLHFCIVHHHARFYACSEVYVGATLAGYSRHASRE